MTRRILLWGVAVFYIGCGEEPESEVAEVGGGEVREGIGMIEGTGVIRPEQDDPAEDGWDTEVWTGEISLVLADFKEAVLGESDEGEVDRLMVEGFLAPALRPRSLQPVGRGVRRWESGGEDLQKMGLAEALRDLGDAFDRKQAIHFKTKVVGIAPAGGGAETRIVVQVDGWDAGSGEALQVNARWECRWKKTDGNWQLETMQLSSYEEVRISGRAFVDVTGSVLPADGAVREQLLRGQDHWMERVEMHHGIDVGGWQGVSIADIDGDGLEDLYVAAPGGLPNRLLKHLPDGSVRDISSEAGVDWLEGTHGSLFADLDNDGDADLVVGVGHGVIVMENDGAGHFSTKATKLLTDGLPYSIAAADIDHDGDLDFFVCGYNSRSGVSRHHVFAHPVPYHDANNGGRNALFRNDGGWRFTDVTKRTGMGLNNTRFSYAASWEDYDQDGDLDLYVANDFGRNNLYRNELVPEGRVFFNDVAAEAGVEDVAPGMSVAWGDFDNDGLSDLYVGNMFSSAGNRVAGQGRFMQNADGQTRSEFLRHAAGNSLFQNEGGGRFADVGVGMGVNLGRWAWSSKFIDLDNDGWQDLVVANGFVTQEDTGDL